MRALILIFMAMQLAACASSTVAQKLSFVSFDEKTENLKSVGSIQGKDCTWYSLGYSLGPDPTVRDATANAVQQRQDSLNPLAEKKANGPPLSLIKNLSVENSGFNAWVVSRSCIVVSGVGYL